MDNSQYQTFKPGDLVWVKEKAFTRNQFERYPWLNVICRCVGHVDRITHSGNAAWVIWLAHNEWHWFPFDELEHYTPRAPRYAFGDRVKVRAGIVEDADRYYDANVDNEGVIVEVFPNEIQQYAVRFSPKGKPFKWQEAELELCQ